MKVHRFLIQEKIEKQSEIKITDSDFLKQVLNVLRLKVNDKIILIDGCGGEFFGIIKNVDRKNIFVEKEKIILHQRENTPQKITLTSAILKKDKYEWILQKGTELGVDEFVPIISCHTEKIKINFERANLIIKEATEQSQRVFMPVLHQDVKLKHYIEQNQDKIHNMIVLDLEAPKIDINFLKEKKMKQDLIILVGPEGGWSEDERKFFEENNLKIFSLGDFVLRAETANLAIVSALQI